jgi:Protein of unknown function (DUF1761)
MLPFNWIAILPTCLIPMLVGFIYYHPKVLGTAWMKIAGMNEESMKNANMGKIFGFTLIFGVFLSVFLLPVVLHAMHAFSLVLPPGGGDLDPQSAAAQDVTAFIAKYGGNFRTFGHGAFHGILTALVGIWPTLGIVSLFERKGWKYTAIHLGYWVITLGLMGGVICDYGVK